MEDYFTSLWYKIKDCFTSLWYKISDDTMAPVYSCLGVIIMIVSMFGVLAPDPIGYYLMAFGYMFGGTFLLTSLIMYIMMEKREARERFERARRKAEKISVEYR